MQTLRHRWGWHWWAVASFLAIVLPLAGYRQARLWFRGGRITQANFDAIQLGMPAGEVDGFLGREYVARETNRHSPFTERADAWRNQDHVLAVVYDSKHCVIAKHYWEIDPNWAFGVWDEQGASRPIDQSLQLAIQLAIPKTRGCRLIGYPPHKVIGQPPPPPGTPQ